MEDVWRGEAQDLLSQIAQLQEENKQLLTNLSHKDVSFSEEEFQKHEGTGRRPCGGCRGQEKAVPAALTHTGRRGKGHSPRARKGAALWDDRSLCLLPSQSLCLRPIVETDWFTEDEAERCIRQTVTDSSLSRALSWAPGRHTGQASRGLFPAWRSW